MPVLHVEAQVTAAELLKAADQLDQSELDQFLKQVLALHAQRRAPSLPANEADLLRAINQGISTELRDRYEALVARRGNGTLTSVEHEELLRLTDQIEASDAARLEHLASLSLLRGVSLDALLSDLGIQAPEYE